MLSLRRDVGGFIKATVVVLVILGALGAGWFYYELTDDLTIGLRVVDADLTQGDTIPLTVEVRVISERLHDIHVHHVEVELYAHEGGPRLTRVWDSDITVPAQGEVTRSYDVVLRNTGAVEDSVYVEVTVRHEDGTDGFEGEVSLDGALPF